MNRITVTIFIFIGWQLNVLNAFAQERNDLDARTQQFLDLADSLQQEELKPEIKLWHLSGYGAFQDTLSLDTSYLKFHKYNPVYKDAITATFLGNYGTPYLNNDFFNRAYNSDFFFLQSREGYLLTPDSIKYYNTYTPYTMLDYSQSESSSRKNETRFNILHSQNVSPFLNFTFRWDQARSDGQYKNQDSKYSIVSLYSSYNKEKFNFYAGFIANSIGNSENGGLSSDTLILSGQETEFMNVNLNNSRSKFNNSYYYINGEYRFGRYEIPEGDSLEIFRPVAGILFLSQYQRHLKEFYDEEDTSNAFFDRTYYGDQYVKDVVRYSKISNLLQIKQYENKERKASFGKRAFIGQEFIRNLYPSRPGAAYSPFITKFSNVFVGGGIFRQTGSFWKWNVEGNVYLAGRNVGQTKISGIISKPLNILGDSLASLNIIGKIENRRAKFFQEKFYSNHFIWENDFKMEQNMTVRGSFKSLKHQLEVGGNYAIINNFIFNDTTGIPTQTNKELLVLSAFVDKSFTPGNWIFKTKLLWQKASDENLIHLPAFSAFVSTSYKFVYSKVLFAQIGADIRYNTSYYADAYEPSLGLFYLQNEKEIGNFPYIDVYTDLRLKRTRFFFKMINIGTEFIDREYFTALHYPMNKMAFRFGVAWAFYD